MAARVKTFLGTLRRGAA
jgi:hypothetical protein